jgi:hypothetical protein
VSWRPKILLLVIAAVPAFTGYPVSRFSGEVVSGAAVSWVVYGVCVHGLIGVMAGARAYGVMLSIAAAVTLPVVMAGAAVSWILLMATGGDMNGVFAYSPRYVALSLRLLTVVPLALAMVAAIPFGRIEQHLLSQTKGVKRRQKALLMAMRVFNHVAFSVIPGILEVIREERLFFASTTQSPPPRAGYLRKIRGWVRTMTFVGVDAICTSVQFIPMWAVEIAQLPEATDPGDAHRPAPGHGDELNRNKENS